MCYAYCIRIYLNVWFYIILYTLLFIYEHFICKSGVSDSKGLYNTYTLECSK